MLEFTAQVVDVKQRKVPQGTCLSHYTANSAKKLSHQMAQLGIYDIKDIESVWAFEDKAIKAYRTSVRELAKKE